MTKWRAWQSLTKDEQEQIVCDYKSGKSIRTISKEWNLDRQKISDFLKINGIETQKKRIDSEKKKIILTSTKSSTELSEDLGIPASTIRAIRNKNGVLKKKLLSELSSEEISNIITDYNNGFSAQKIGDKYGWSKKSILTLLNKNGVDTSTKIIFSKDEEQFIVDNYHNASSVYLAKLFNVSSSLISLIWSKHGLKGKRRSQYVLNEDYFAEINTPAKAYFLGFLASDGCLWEDDYRYIVKLELQARDKHILELFNKEIKTNKPLVTAANGKYFCLEICSKKIFKDLIKLGLSTQKTQKYKLHILDNEELMPHFMRGFFDGDGCITYTHKSPTKKIVPSDFAVTITGATYATKTIHNYLNEQGIQSALYDVTANKYNFGCYTISFNSNENIYDFLNYIYKDCEEICLKRKLERAKLFMEIYCNKYQQTNLFIKNAV